MRRSWRLIAILLLALPSACRHLPWGARAVHECPGALVPTQEIEGEFLLREHLRVTAGDRAFGFELAVQKRGDELVLVGLHPLGAKLFSVRQVGSEVSVEAHPAPALEVPPENVLRDVHRVHFFDLPQPPSDGVVEGHRGETQIRERWEAGELRERSVIATGASANAAEVSFSRSASAGEEMASVNNPRCGYRAEFRLLSRQDLP
jgi:hypothetical protein